MGEDWCERLRGIAPRGGSYVWQTKELREQLFGSVAMIRLTGGFPGSVANKGVRPEAPRCCALGMARKRGWEAGQWGRKILRLAVLAQDDYPRRIVILEDHREKGARRSARDAKSAHKRRAYD